MRIRFTEQPVRHTASAVQSIYQVIDLGGRYRVLDLILSTYFLTVAEATVTIQTAMEATDDDGWVILGQFAKEDSGPNKYQLASFVGALRYVRYSVSVSGAGAVVFDISGYARVRS